MCFGVSVRACLCMRIEVMPQEMGELQEQRPWVGKQDVSRVQGQG